MAKRLASGQDQTITVIDHWGGSGRLRLLFGRKKHGLLMNWLAVTKSTVRGAMPSANPAQHTKSTADPGCRSVRCQAARSPVAACLCAASAAGPQPAHWLFSAAGVHGARRGAARQWVGLLLLRWLSAARCLLVVLCT